MRRFVIASLLTATAVWASAASAQSTGTVGSASFATHRSCATTPSTSTCGGELAGQQIVDSSYGGGLGIGGLNSLDVGGGNVSWSNVSFDPTTDLPVIRAFTAAPGNERMNINAFGFQSFRFDGADGTPFTLAGDLHIVNSSGTPTAGAEPGKLPGGSVYTQYVGVWNPSVIAGLTTAQQLFNALFYADCSTSGVLGFGLGSGNLAGGEQTLSVSTTGCSGPLTLSHGQEVLVVTGLQLPVNRGGFADSTATFRTKLDDSVLTPQQIANLQNNLVSAVDRGASLRDVATITAGVPEPATWALLLMGFGAIGTVMRRKLRQSEQRFTEKMRRIAAGETD